MQDNSNFCKQPPYPCHNAKNCSDLLELFSYIKSLSFEQKPSKLNQDTIVKIEPTDDESINIKIMGLTGTNLKFKIKKTSCFDKLMVKYSDIVGIPKETIRFRFDGIALSPNLTPLELSMQDGDIIETYLQQIGGGKDEPTKETSESTTSTEETTNQEPSEPLGWRENGPSTSWGINFNNIDNELNSLNRRTKRMSMSKLVSSNCRCGQQASSLRKNSLEKRYSWLFNKEPMILIRAPTKIIPSHPFPYTRDLIENKMLTIAIEGNIGAGKTTLMEHLRKMAVVLTIREPIKKWCDIANFNLFEHMNQRPKKWAFAFQVNIITTMMNNHLHPTKPKIIERSVHSARNVFTKLQQIRNTIPPPQAKILEDLYTLMTNHLNTNVDITIYIRTDPEIVAERIKKRARYEERDMKLDYLKLVNELYDRWLLHQKDNKKIIVINGNLSTDEMIQELESKIGIKNRKNEIIKDTNELPDKS